MLNKDQKIITREELVEIEKKKLTKAQEYLRIFVLVLPILMGFISILEYNFIKNKITTSESTSVYTYFLIILIIVYISLNILSLKNKKLREYLEHKAPFYSFIFLLFSIYDVLTLKTNILQMPFFPSVDKLLNVAYQDRAYLFECVVSSLKLLFTGYFIGSVLGLISGILCGYSKKVNYWISPFMKLLGPIPTTTWLPIVMAIASTLYNGAVFIIALGVWYAVTSSTMTGIIGVDKSYYEAAKTLGLKDNQLILKVAIPSAVPNIFQGLTVGMSSACTSLMIAEMLGVESGLGWYITWQKSWAEYGKMYAAIVLICITFIIVNWILSKIRRYVLRWQEGI